MKKLKLNFGILALVMGIALAFVSSSFKAEQAKTLAESWFEYDLSGDPTAPENYSAVGGTPSCNADGAVCSIFAEVNGAEPVIDGALETEINAAIAVGSSNHPNVKLYE